MTAPPPEPLGTRRTTWASAAELQQAADRLRTTAPHIADPLGSLANPVADWLDETANALAWLAPFREHEPGHRMWQTASKVARVVNGSASESRPSHLGNGANAEDCAACSGTNLPYPWTCPGQPQEPTP
ncbi:hypothetical protein ACFY8P_35335 [Streptomyces sp. NPDC012693]|uniref:hypothetical protein n=1 Tax=Streptomyces sp. NPDC012693 TaxID=3364844 RepID=UPI003685923D